MKKFAAIAAASLLLLSVFCFSCSAKLFSDDTYYEYTLTFGQLPSYVSQTFKAYEIYIYDNQGNILYCDSVNRDEPLVVYRNYSGAGDYPPLYVGFGDTHFSVPSSYEPTVVLHSTAASLTYGSTTRNGTEITVAPVVPSLSDNVFSVGSSLISFITANWITLLAITCFIVVLSFGTIRRLVKGV